MNSFYQAAITGWLASFAFLASMVFYAIDPPDREREGLFLRLGLILLSSALALTLFTIGHTVQKISDGLNQFGQEMQSSIGGNEP